MTSPILSLTCLRPAYFTLTNLTLFDFPGALRAHTAHGVISSLDWTRTSFFRFLLSWLGVGDRNTFLGKQQPKHACAAERTAKEPGSFLFELDLTGVFLDCFIAADMKKRSGLGLIGLLGTVEDGAV